jgi:predicted transcriptional regulator
VSTPIEQLQQLGFSQYEAQAYVALLQRSPLTGYELAKVSSIPRPNIYPVLARLEERGAVVRLEDAGGSHYAPVAADELVRHLQSQFHTSLEAARSSLSQIGQVTEHEHIWNARGYPAMLEHAQTVVDGAQAELLVAVWPQEAEALGASIESAERRGVQVNTLCLADCANECGHCHGQVHRYPVAPRLQERWLVLIPDQHEVLAGEIKSAGETLAVRTCQKMLVSLSTWYIRHSIALAAVLRDAGDQIEALLTPETRHVLESVGPGGAEGGWLEHMRQLLASK